MPNARMNTLAPSSDQPLAQVPPDLAVDQDAPLLQLWRRLWLAGSALEMLRCRLAVLMLLAWVPLLELSVAEGRAWGGSVRLPFLYDVETHLRLLLALPLLVLADLVIHPRMRPVVRHFVKGGLIPEAERGRFDVAVASALRLRQSVLLELNKFPL